VVIPEVNARLRGHGIALYPVDLRWGIETDDRQVAAQRQRTILEVCADEVRRCRPLFIGLLGDRYGWLPPPDVESAARRAAGIADPGFPLSAMALEILVALNYPEASPPRWPSSPLATSKTTEPVNLPTAPAARRSDFTSSPSASSASAPSRCTRAAPN
jgi:hypothetical protein